MALALAPPASIVGSHRFRPIPMSDPQRLIEPVYRERCIHTLISIVLDLNNYRGSARLFIP
jgi:hypothetical protein